MREEGFTLAKVMLSVQAPSSQNHLSLMDSPSQNPAPQNPHPIPGVNLGPKRSGMAVAAMILGIVSLVLPPLTCFLLSPVGMLTAVLALIFGLVAMSTIKSSQGQVSGRGMALSGVILGGLTLLLAVGFLVSAIVFGESSPPEFTAAEDLIEDSSKGVGHGNTPEAEAAAVAVANELKGNEHNKDGGDFIVYCRLNDDSAAFLVQLPDGISAIHEDEVAEAAWIAAQAALADTALPAGAELAVGARDFMLWGEVLIGTHVKEGSPGSGRGLVNSDGSESDLEEFFREDEEAEAVQP